MDEDTDPVVAELDDDVQPDSVGRDTLLDEYDRDIVAEFVKGVHRTQKVELVQRKRKKNSQKTVSERVQAGRALCFFEDLALLVFERAQETMGDATTEESKIKEQNLIAANFLLFGMYADRVMNDEKLCPLLRDDIAYTNAMIILKRVYTDRRLEPLMTSVEQVLDGWCTTARVVDDFENENTELDATATAELEHLDTSYANVAVQFFCIMGFFVKMAAWSVVRNDWTLSDYETRETSWTNLFRETLTPLIDRILNQTEYSVDCIIDSFRELSTTNQ